MAIVEGVIGVGFLGIGGFGVWRGQSLLSRHIELKHERELAKLSVQRMEKSAKLEMALTRNLAEIEAIKTLPASSVALAPTSGEQSSCEKSATYLCKCSDSPAAHVHTYMNSKERIVNIHAAAVERVGKGDLNGCAYEGKPLDEYVLLRPKR